MTRMVCPEPECPYDPPEGAIFCYIHAVNLKPASAGPPTPALRVIEAEPADVGESISQVRGAPSAAGCWNCGQPNSGTGGVSCIACAKPLTPPLLELRFPGGQVTLSKGERTPVGRDATESPHAHLFAAHDNVSRLHATVGVDERGGAWIRDEQSTNGTFVNGVEIKGTIPRRLSHGDQIRLGADATAVVYINL